MEQINFTKKDIKSLMKRPPTAFFHCGKHLIESTEADKLDFINIIRKLLIENGYETYCLQMCKYVENMAAADTKHLHIVLHDRPLNGHNIFSCVPAYLTDHWYFDEVGTRNNSSIRLKTFSPQGMSGKFARTVFEKQKERFISNNYSKFDQTNIDGFKPRKNSICIFTQDFKKPPYHKHFMTYPELIETVISNRNGQHVYIKPHPLQHYDEAQTIMKHHNPNNGVSVTTHSIHGLLEKASVAVSLTSAVCFEANLHKVPSILGGQTDYHHNAITLTDPSKFPDALHEATTREFHYEKYITWFLKQQLWQPKLIDKTVLRLEKVFAQSGYPMGKLSKAGYY